MQVDNTMNYATRILSNHMASMAVQVGILQQQVDELKQANQLLKEQLKQKEGKANDAAEINAHDGQKGTEHPAAAPAAK